MDQTTELLSQWVAAAPKRALAVAKILRDAGLSEDVIQRELKLKIGKPEVSGEQMATFDPKVMHTLSPMLRARFTFAGTIRDATETWPALSGVAKAMARPGIRRTIRSMADHWEGSVPATVAPGRMSLLSFSPTDADCLTLLVWPGERGDKEPAVVRYAGQSEQRFGSLNAFLQWALA